MGRRTPAARYECRATISAERLRELRNENRYAATEWAERWGVTATAIYQWERGERPIPCWVDRAVIDLKLPGVDRRALAAAR